MPDQGGVKIVVPELDAGQGKPLNLPLGEALKAAGLADDAQIERALDAARHWDVPLGQAVMALGLVHPRDLFRALAAHLDLAFLDLIETPPPRHLSREEELDFYLAAEAVPVDRSAQGIVLATPDPLAAALTLSRFRARGRAAPGERANFAVTARLDVLWTLQARFEDAFKRRARFGLAESDPVNSAHSGASRGQRAAGGVAALVLAAGLVGAPAMTLAALNVLLGLCFALVIVLKALSIPYGIIAARQRGALPVAALPGDAELPIYTVIVPLRDEARVLPLLADALRRIDYPPAKLDIKLVIEGDDAATLAQAKALGLESNVTFLRVPPSHPRTKPKACNAALEFARGAFTVIFDAEDQPEPLQLRKAVAAFRQLPEDVACLQASLTYFNARENWLTAQFTIEFATWFDLLLPTASRLGMPIPLGGTSTHFRTDVLRELGAWDPYNVTEDADLGIRLAQKGYRCEILASTTREEANCATGNWVRQRSRWIKGYLQTWLVHMRQPRALLKALGPAGFIGFHLLIGGSILSALAHPAIWIAALAGLAVDGSALAYLYGPAVPALLIWLNASLLGGGYAVSVVAGAVGIWLRGNRKLIWHTPMMPLYWLLISFAGYKAVFQLLTRPFFWEKTSHGISRSSRAQLARLRGSDDRDGGD